MKKITINKLIMSVITMTFFAPVLALAATTASFSPASANVTVGQKFNIAISVNPQGTNDYAEKLEVNYPADILEATSFTFGANWMAMSQAGYDSIDNTNGILIKTAGYPGGFSSTTILGTISFSAKVAGSGTIKIGNSSLAFQASGQSALFGNGASFVVTSPVIVPPAPVAPVAPQVVAPLKSEVKKPAPAPSEIKPATTTEATTTELLAETLPSLQVAAAGTSGSGSTLVQILVVAAFLAIVGYGAYMLGLKKRGDN